eukprot:CAMPEP_0113871632 /NCGR_PEP_ID=MMETSP0780_2-20120614/2754_1 /TAXON_ID=652834 /ORGANISM="Palpitomonas bilix" /LENGTH=312 /DNA_ID=CAMNT_0000857051 /DNA_START=143 /DNA_END=1081 /DNA_ORIENTATION=- /assembly_acc=CAM_ASM_000599
MMEQDAHAHNAPCIIIDASLGDAYEVWELMEEIRFHDPYLLVCLGETKFMDGDQWYRERGRAARDGIIPAPLFDRDIFAEFALNCSNVFLVLNSYEKPDRNLPASVPSNLSSLIDMGTAEGEKRVWLIRHGQSEANIRSYYSAAGDPTLRDCPLSPEGHKQAQQLREKLSELKPPLVVCSPLRRAIQTALHVFGRRKGLPLVAHPFTTEFWTDAQESKGREREEILADPQLIDMEGFSRISFRQLWADWGHIGDDHGRLNLFMEWVKLQPFDDIVVVAHYGFISYLAANHGVRHMTVENCSTTMLSFKESSF